MMENRIVSQDLEHKIANQVRKSQENMNNAIKAWMDTTRSLRPKLPELSESLPAGLPGREKIVANASEVSEQARVAQQRIAEQVRKAAEPWTKQMHQVREAYVPWSEQMQEFRKAAKPLADQVRHAYVPWTEQMQQARKAAKPLADQMRKATAPLTGVGTLPATASKGTSKTPAHAPAAKASTSATAKTGTARKPRTTASK